MIYQNGIIHKECAYRLCKEMFAGRRNKYFCCPKCKQLHNNEKATEVSKSTLGIDLKIRKATRILIKLFKADSEGKCKISVVDLVNQAFPFDLPTFTVKDDRYNGELFSFGTFAFNKEQDYFVFYKLK